VDTRPSRPVSKTETAQAREVAITELRPEPDSPHPTYRKTEAFRLVERKMRLDTRVTLPGDERFALAGIRLRNREQSNGPVLLDQDDGNVHDGLHLLNGIGLVGRGRDSSDYWVGFPGRGTTPYGDHDRWTTFRPSDWSVLFDRRRALLAGVTYADTTPKMWVLEDTNLDMMVNEVTLRPGQSVRYVVVLGLAAGGEGATDRAREAFRRAREWTDRLEVDSLVP
jgi:hypothetical protein